jgi:hypothetical protein
MKRFSDIQKRNKVRKINEAEANLPDNYEDMSKEELIKLMSGSKQIQPEPEKEENTDKEETKTEKSGAVKFFSKLFESREMAHVYHLQVKGDMGSHAKHIALQEYYEGDEGDEEGEGGILDSLDTLIEMYQGQFGLIEGYDTIDTSETMSKDPIEYFTELADFVKSERHNCFDKEDTHYFNLIDDVLVLIYRLLYKLKYTK